MSFVKGFVMSLGMFSIIPVPKNSWNEKYMHLVIPSLPLAGALIGLLWYGFAYALAKLSPPPLIQCAAVLFAPFALNGFIHADGCMDTADAVFSRGSAEEKRRILKDPNVGAFAVIAIIVIVLFQFCAVKTILDTKKTLLAFAFIPVISRCVAGIALLNLKPAFETGYNASFRNGTKLRHTVFVCLIAVLTLATAWLALGLLALPLLAEALAGTAAAAYLCTQFRGMSGDLCGCVITVGELAAVLCMALI